MKSVPASVDDHIARLSGDVRTAIERLRAKIKSLLPDAEETIGYGVPTYKLNGHNVVHFAGFKNHCSLFPGSEAIEQFADELKAFKTSKGTIQFTPENPIPDDLLERIVRSRASAALARRKRKR